MSIALFFFKCAFFYLIINNETYNSKICIIARLKTSNNLVFVHCYCTKLVNLRFCTALNFNRCENLFSQISESLQIWLEKFISIFFIRKSNFIIRNFVFILFNLLRWVIFQSTNFKEFFCFPS